MEASRNANASELANPQRAVDGMRDAVEEADEHITSHGLAEHQEFCRLVQDGLGKPGRPLGRSGTGTPVPQHRSRNVDQSLNHPLDHAGEHRSDRV